MFGCLTCPSPAGSGFHILVQSNPSSFLLTTESHTNLHFLLCRRNPSIHFVPPREGYPSWLDEAGPHRRQSHSHRGTIYSCRRNKSANHLFTKYWVQILVSKAKMWLMCGVLRVISIFSVSCCSLVTEALRPLLWFSCRALQSLAAGSLTCSGLWRPLFRASRASGPSHSVLLGAQLVTSLPVWQ